MKYLFLIILFISTPAFADTYEIPKYPEKPAVEADINDTKMATPTCETYVEWTGKNIDEIDLSVLGDRQYRIIKPDSMVTMDYQPNRLNINVTDDGVILTQECG